MRKSKCPKTPLTRMMALRDELVRLFLEEAEPNGWPSNETQQGRGDRLALKKNAEATGRLAARAFELCARLALVQPFGKPSDQPDIDAREHEIERLNDEAMRILERHRARQGGLSVVGRT